MSNRYQWRKAELSMLESSLSMSCSCSLSLNQPPGGDVGVDLGSDGVSVGVGGRERGGVPVRCTASSYGFPSRHVAGVDEIEIVLLESPVFFEIVDFELYVGQDLGRLNRRQIWKLLAGVSDVMDR